MHVIRLHFIKNGYLSIYYKLYVIHLQIYTTHYVHIKNQELQQFYPICADVVLSYPIVIII